VRFTALSSLTLVMALGCSYQPAIDLDAERNALMSADRAWSEAYAASESPADVFAAQVLENGSLLPPDAPLAQGREAIHAAIAGLEAMPGFSVTWSPSAADVGSGGDLGYTMGTYEINVESPEGPVTIIGKYLTIWKKQADGTWMVTADMFNADGPPTPQM
jgi:ketosteroid isomerase-like protein